MIIGMVATIVAVSYTHLQIGIRTHILFIQICIRILRITDSYPASLKRTIMQMLFLPSQHNLKNNMQISKGQLIRQSCV